MLTSLLCTVMAVGLDAVPSIESFVTLRMVKD